MYKRQVHICATSHGIDSNKSFCNEAHAIPPRYYNSTPSYYNSTVTGTYIISNTTEKIKIRYDPDDVEMTANDTRLPDFLNGKKPPEYNIILDVYKRQTRNR